MRSTPRTLAAVGLVGGSLAASMLVAPAALAAPSPTPPVSTPAPKPQPLKATLTLAKAGKVVVGEKPSVKVNLRVKGKRYGGELIRIQTRTSTKAKWKNVASGPSNWTQNRTITIPAMLKTTYVRAVHEATPKVRKATSKTLKLTPASWGSGSSSKVVRKAQKKLKKLGIRPASVDGKFGGNTQQAVMAFQKYAKLPRTGRLDATTYVRLVNAKRIKAPKWCTSSITACVDRTRQIMFFKAKNGQQYLIPVSTGGKYWFYNKKAQERQYAETPTGTWSVYFKRPGLTDGALGVYYWASFFHRGYAIHGSNSIPSYAASHGCVRVPRSVEKMVYDTLTHGKVVRVRD